MKQCGRNHPGYPDDGTLPGMGGANPITWSIGTSFAAPAVTGAAGLVSKWYKNGHGGIRSSPAMTKAMLINAALDIYGGRRGVQIVDHIPSPYQGWGKVDLTRATPPSSHWAVDQSWSLSSGQSFEIVLQRNNLGLPVRATLAWTDPAASDGDPHPLVNDLDLVIVASDGPCYAGNQFNEATGQSLAVSCASPTLDSNNNVENAIFSLTLTQWFRVKVIAKAGMQGTQDFALFVDNAYIY